MKKQMSKDLFVIALPIMVEMIVEYLLRFTDTAFLGNYSAIGLSAVQNAMIPYFMFMAFFMALSKGTTILLSHEIGAGNKLKAEKYAESAFFFNHLISLLFFVFWAIFSSDVLTIMGAKGAVHSAGLEYLQVYAFNFLFFGIVLTARSIFEGVGKTFPIMIATVTAVILNVFLDWVLIFGYLGFPELGIMGAALATVISKFVGAIILIFYIFKIDAFKIRMKFIFKPNYKLYLKAFRLGLPSGLDFMLFMLGQTVIIMMLNRVDKLLAGIFGVFNLLINFSLFLYLGIGIAALTLVGQSVGAKKWAKGLLVGHLSMLYATIICFVTAILFFLLPREILGVFTDNMALIDKYYYYMFVISFLMFPKAINVVVGNSIKGYGNTKWMLYTQIPGTIFVIIVSYILIFVYDTGLLGIFIAMFFDELFRGIVNYVKFYRFMKKGELLHLEEQSGD